MRKLLGAVAVMALAACNQAKTDNDSNAATANAAAASGAELILTRLDCGRADFKDMNAFFSDRPGVYPPGPGKVTDSCYLIRHGDKQMVWDTGLPASTKNEAMEGGMTASVDVSLADQLKQLGLKPEDIDIVGISHMHSDHTGQAAQFAKANLIIGRADFDQTKGDKDPFLPWRQAKAGAITFVSGESDVFGDGSVKVLHLPGHTPDHLALLVNLKSGPVLLTGDLYHSTIAREKRSLPPFNTSRKQTLQSMDKFEALAKQLGAKVIIQHEPNDISKLPAFPQAAQ